MAIHVHLSGPIKIKQLREIKGEETWSNRGDQMAHNTNDSFFAPLVWLRN